MPLPSDTELVSTIFGVDAVMFRGVQVGYINETDSGWAYFDSPEQKWSNTRTSQTENEAIINLCQAYLIKEYNKNG